MSADSGYSAPNDSFRKSVQPLNEAVHLFAVVLDPCGKNSSWAESLDGDPGVVGPLHFAFAVSALSAVFGSTRRLRLSLPYTEEPGVPQPIILE